MFIFNIFLYKCFDFERYGPRVTIQSDRVVSTSTKPNRPPDHVIRPSSHVRVSQAAIYCCCCIVVVRRHDDLEARQHFRGSIPRIAAPVLLLKTK